jgi:hypothetical protein
MVDFISFRNMQSETMLPVRPAFSAPKVSADCEQIKKATTSKDSIINILFGIFSLLQILGFKVLRKMGLICIMQFKWMAYSTLALFNPLLQSPPFNLQGFPTFMEAPGWH